MTLLLSFPSEAPYRIDQVTSNPEAMLALAIGQLVLAACMRWWLGRRWSGGTQHAVLHPGQLGHQRHHPLQPLPGD